VAAHVVEHCINLHRSIPTGSGIERGDLDRDILQRSATSSMTTTRLYYTDSYLSRFDAHVAGVADDGRRVYLDRTAFYPTSGGQLHDIGTLAGVEVVDVIDEGDRIGHLLAAPLASDSHAVSGAIDWPRRFDHMQQHTGQHLLSAVLEELFGYRTLSVHFGRDYSSLDLDAESLSPEKVVGAEQRANALVVENRRVTTRFENAAEATGLRKASDREGTLRIIEIEGLDRSACGGTHVRSTGEIGAILVRKVERVRKAARVEFVCGVRAVKRARADFEALTRIASSLSAALDDAPTLVTAQVEQLRAAENDRRRYERELAGFRARALYDTASATDRGVRVVRHAAGSMDELRAIAQGVTTLSNAALVGTVADPPGLLFATAEDTGIDAGRVLREAVTSVGGRGGGSPRVAQGTAPDITKLDQAVTTILRLL
jgi:alanyl-tRNA synthetase